MTIFKQVFLVSLGMIILIIPACGQDATQSGVFADIVTDKGSIEVELFYKRAPLTVMNFVGLAEGKLKTNQGDGPFYDNLTFHRVVDEFVIQGGDPVGNGTGGPGYSFPDEFHSELRHDGPGILSMANSGPGTNGSQFFITHKETPWLDDRHSVFGKVVEGMNVVNAIQEGDAIQSIRIRRVGDDAKEFVVSQEKFDQLIADMQEEENKALQAEYKDSIAEIQKRWPDAESFESGLYINRERTTNNPKPKTGETVQVHYKGTFFDGTLLDSSYERGEPLELELGANRVIPGWEEAITYMGYGDSITAIIPPELAYGEAGIPNVIPPNSFLIFEMELLPKE